MSGNGKIIIEMPVSPAGLAIGTLWNNAGTLNVVIP